MLVYQINHMLCIKAATFTLIIILALSTTTLSTRFSTSDSRGSTYQSSAEDFEVVRPLITRTSKRTKRHIKDSPEANSSDPGSFRIQFTAFNRSFDARLVLNTKLLTPATAVHILGVNGNTLYKNNLENCFYNGMLDSEPDSFVSISNCQGLNGIIHTGLARYTMKPSKNWKDFSYGNRPYDIQRQFHSQSNPYGSYMPPSFDTEGMDKEMASRLRKRRAVESVKRGEQTIETLLVVDQKMVQYHGLDAAKQYALTVASIAHQIFRDPSIGANTINLVIVKVLILVAEQENLIINHHAQKTLNSFGAWAGLQLKDTDTYNFDYAVLFTRFDICKDSEEPCDNSGISFVGGMCKFPTSASVIQDNGLSSAFALAHHTGHTLGMEHDGIGNSCEGQHKIMDKNGGRGEGAYLWSTCSAEYMQRFLRTKQSACLSDLPSKEESSPLNPFINSGSIYDLDSQCKLFAGEKAKGCYYGDPVEVCVEVLCYVPGHSSCIGTGKPAVDGSSCGKNKWCKHGRCIQKHFTDAGVIDGGWSMWTDFTACTRPCGGGTMFRERTCHNPKPKHGGKFCEGDTREYRTCHPKACDESVENFRKQQCKKKSGTFLGDKKYNWTFLGEKEFSCTLICSAESDDSITKHFGRALDGTRCYDQTSNVPGRCVAGKCTPVGCNLVLGSKEKPDRCGVCGGDGSSCDQALSLGQTRPAIFVNVTDKRAYANKKPGTNLTKLFNETMRIEHSGNSTMQNSTIANATMNKMNGNKTLNVTDDMDHISNVLQKLKMLRTLMKNVLRKRCANNEKCLMRYKYFDLKHKRTEVPVPKDFEWVVISSGCSVTCGTGTEILSSECRRIDDGSPVARKYCVKKFEPVVKKKACHMPPCLTRWAFGDWESCSKSCGGGVMSRDVYCVKNINDDFVLSKEMCDASSKPRSKQICNKEACPAKWVTEPFGKCSTSCGKGIQRREVFCMLDRPYKSQEIVDDSRCEATRKPQREMICNVHYPCPGDDNCGGNFTEKSGVITSPGFPGEYPNNKECISEITVPDDKSIMLEFTELKIGGETDSMNHCGDDFLRVTDGSCADAIRLPYTVYCGLQKPDDVYISTQNKMCLKFVSDDTGSNKGFSIKYTAVNKRKDEEKLIDICDVHGQTINSLFGAINSPNYPEIYPVNEHCRLAVTAPDMSGFLLSFKGFNVGTKSAHGKCADDYLQIEHDGISRKLCGDAKSMTQISTFANKFIVSFHSADIRISGVGFVLTYITKNFLKKQFDFINQKKQEKLLGYKPINNFLGLQKISNAVASNLRNTYQRPKLPIEALTSLKKDNIDQPKTVSNKTKPITDALSLKNVLDLLGGAKQPGTSTAKKSNITAKSKSFPEFEDYTKAGIYKKAGVPTVSQRTNKDKNGGTNSSPFRVGFGAPKQLRGAVTQQQMSSPSNEHKLLPKNTQHLLSSAEQWKMYWNAYRKLNSRRNSIPARPNNSGVSPYWSPNSNYNVPKSYTPEQDTSNTKVYGRTCPAVNTLSCGSVALSYACSSIANCGYHPRMNCCQTFCPYKPFVCVWT